MLWNEPKRLPDGSVEPRTGQPQSAEEYDRWSLHFPDPQAPTTHLVVYHWEDSPNSPRSPRRIVFDCPPKSETGKPAEITKPEPQGNESRRKELNAMSRPSLATAYGVAGLGDLPDKMSQMKAIAAILDAESKGATANV